MRVFKDRGEGVWRDQGEHRGRGLQGVEEGRVHRRSEVGSDDLGPEPRGSGQAWVGAEDGGPHPHPLPIPTLSPHRSFM